MTKKLYIIDGTSYIYRAYWAIRGLSNSEGFPTNAIYGFTSMLIKVLRDFSPTHIAIVFDLPGPTFRDELFPEYKATRPPAPEDLLPQIPVIKEIVKLFGVPSLEIAGVEADDVIGTMARRAEESTFDVIIVTGDKDLMQLVTDKVTIYDSMEDRRYGVQEVIQKWGVEPARIPEVMGLSGDPIDNIPGIPRIGEKTAAQLIREFGNVEGVLENAEKVKRKDIRANLIAYGKDALMSRELATIKTDVFLGISPDDLKPGNRDVARLHELFSRLGFQKFLKDLIIEKTLATRGYRLVLKEEDFMKLAERLCSSRAFAFDLETTSADPMSAELVGVSFSCSDGEAYYVPLAHSYLGVPEQMPLERVLEVLKPIFEDEKIRKAAQNAKYDMIVLRRKDVVVKGLTADTMIASYLLDPSRRNHSLEDIALIHLDHKLTTYKEVTKVGRREIPFNEVDVETAMRYSCEDADVTFRAAHILLEKLKMEGLEELYRNIEIPLLHVLMDMEMTGVKLDVELLSELSRGFEATLSALSAEIWNLAGEEFNINSSQQLSRILFEKFKFKRMKRTRTGTSTDSEVLSELASLGHELPAKVLDYRMISKLKNTYADGLRALVNPRTGRVHTSFNQTVTATGRLSSSDPNLQNIPIRTSEGRKIRSAFIAEDGYVLLSADYSQIELRLLAHMSRDERMLECFRRGEDIHAATAAEVFGVALSDVTSDMRRRAKAVNFGIVYGLSPYGLSKELGITTDEAKEYIVKYFAKYPGVQAFITRTLEEARRNRFVTTMFGRRRNIQDIMSTRSDQRHFAERVAINTPLQGTAADIIKIAMINLHREIACKFPQARMLIQVHDELVFEVPEEHAGEFGEFVRNIMSSVVKLEVPLVVDVHYAKNWADAHA